MRITKLQVAAFAVIGLAIGTVSSVSFAADEIPLSQIPMPPAEQRFPVRTSSLAIAEAYSHIPQWEGRWVSVEGTVKAVVYTSAGQPSVELSFSKLGKMTLWTMWAPADAGNMGPFLQVGQTLRVGGWMKATAAWAKAVHVDLPRQNPMTMVAVCVVIPSNAIFDSDYVEACEAWRKDVTPPNLDAP
jgi:hypothetical protein